MDQEKSVSHSCEMLDVWCWALSWYIKPPINVEKRAKQSALVYVLKTELYDISSNHELIIRYRSDSRWTLHMARKTYPRDWPTLGVHAVTAATFGIRHVEIMTNRVLDPRRPLPMWIGEWAIW